MCEILQGVAKLDHTATPDGDENFIVDMFENLGLEEKLKKCK